MQRRTPFFLAVEGESEQSFVKWLYELGEQEETHIQLHCKVLGGGSYQTMLNKAVTHRNRSPAKYKNNFLLVDADRTVSGDDWSMKRLAEEARARDFILCCQQPNFEGLLLRMLAGEEKKIPRSGPLAHARLTRLWSAYEKPVDAGTLGRKYVLNDLKRVADCDEHLAKLLRLIGLLK